MAAESAVIVAISPLAIIDMFFIAWRNIRLINKIAAIYGIELGYFTRLRLLRMVLVNLAFAGATEIVQDLGWIGFHKILPRNFPHALHRVLAWDY